MHFLLINVISKWKIALIFCLLFLFYNTFFKHSVYLKRLSILSVELSQKTLAQTQMLNTQFCYYITVLFCEIKYIFTTGIFVLVYDIINAEIILVLLKSYVSNSSQTTELIFFKLTDYKSLAIIVKKNVFLALLTMSPLIDFCTSATNIQWGGKVNLFLFLV